MSVVLELAREARRGRGLRAFFAQLAALAQLEKKRAQPAEKARIENLGLLAHGAGSFFSPTSATSREPLTGV